MLNLGDIVEFTLNTNPRMDGSDKKVFSGKVIENDKAVYKIDCDGVIRGGIKRMVERGVISVNGKSVTFMV